MGIFFLQASTGRSMTGEELKAAAGNPQLGLSRHLRGGLSKKTAAIGCPQEVRING